MNEPAELSVTVISPVDVPRHGLNAYIVFPGKEYELLSGDITLPVTIRAGEPIHFSAVVAFKETGYWHVSAWVSELVIKGPGPLGMYHRSPKDTMFLKIGVDQSTFEHLPYPPPSVCKNQPEE